MSSIRLAAAGYSVLSVQLCTKGQRASVPLQREGSCNIVPMASEAEHTECWSGEFCPVCNPITCSGFLHQRLRFGRWKRRWFKLYGRGTMMIYDKESSSTPVSMIDIKHTCRDVHVGVRPGRFPSWVPFACTFVISLHNKRLFLYASSVSDALQWVKALRQTSDGFRAGQRETRVSDHHLAILQRSGADISARPGCSHDNDIPPPPPVPAVLPVLPDNAAMTDGLAAEDDTAAIPVCLPSTGKEAHRTASFTLPESFSRDRNSSNRKRKEALWHILKKQQVEVQLAERGVYVTPLRGDDESPELGSRQPHQVRAIGSREDDRQTPMMTSSDTVPATSEPVDSHSKRMPTTASFTGIKASPFRRSKTSKHDRASCAEGCHSNGKSEKEVGARRKAMKVKRPVSAQPQLESLPERESPIGASKTSLNEDLGDAQLHVSSRMQSMETFTSLNFSDDHEPPPFRSQSCADSIHRSRDASIPDFSSPSPFVQAECTPRPKAITRLHHGRVARKDATKPPTTSRNVTFSEFPTIYSVTDVPDEDEEDSPVARDDERRKWWEDSTCAPLQYTPTRQGAVVKRRGVGTTPRVYSKQHPTMDSEISELLRQIAMLGHRNMDRSHTVPYGLLRLNAANHFTDIIQVITSARKQALVMYTASPESGEIYLTTTAQDGTLV